MTQKQLIDQFCEFRGKCTTDDVVALNFAYEMLAPHWISVKEELPKINPNGSEWEYSDDVLVTLKDDSIAVGRYERDNSTGEHYWMLYGVDKDLVVTHWMRKPQSPVLSNSGKTGKNHLIDANNMVDHFADVSKMVEEGGEE